MVWKDVLIGFTVAGGISAFIPESYFQVLFLGSDGEQDHFALNYGFVFNIIFILVSVVMVWLWRRATSKTDEHHHNGSASLTDWILRGLTIVAIVWLTTGVLLPSM